MSAITHNVEFLVESHWARMNVLAWSYTDIAESAYDDYMVANENYVPLPEDDDPTEHFESHKNILESSFKTIVFSAMACEAAIFDLAAIQLGDDYAEKYLDKLDIVGKWVVVPKLICGKPLNISGPAINSLRELIHARNALVHHKSLPGLPDSELIRKADKQMSKIINRTDVAFKAVVLTCTQLSNPF
ncbi:hypothetical protein [Marinobacter nauticus]|uniref:hypothetical protein n=1 Tax=Marinobacter nauticus TaxID=2743 RepID=UPI004044C6C5